MGVKISIKIGKNGHVPLALFNVFVNVSKVDSYTLTELDGGIIELKFYDAKGKLLKTKSPRKAVSKKNAIK